MREQIIQALLNQQGSTITAIEKELKTINAAVDIDEEDVIEPEDLSHQDEADEMYRLQLGQLKKARYDLVEIKNQTAQIHSVIEEGAIVVTQGDLIIYIGVSIKPFDLNDKRIIGISCDAPAFQNMKNKTKNDQFKMGDYQVTIKQIL